MSAAAGVMVGKRLGRKEYDEAYTESKKIMYAGLAGAVAVSALDMDCIKEKLYQQLADWN